MESLIKDILINITEYNFNPIFRDLSRLTENLIGKLKTCHDYVTIFINLETIIKNVIFLYMEESLKVHWVAENLVNKESENVKEETKDNDITETSANKNEAINNKPSELLDTVTKEIPLEKVIAPEIAKSETKESKEVIERENKTNNVCETEETSPLKVIIPKLSEIKEAEEVIEIDNKPSEFLNTATKEVSWPNMNLPK